MEGRDIDGWRLVASLVGVELIRSHVLIGGGCLFIWLDWLASRLGCFSGRIFSDSSSFLIINIRARVSKQPSATAVRAAKERERLVVVVQ